MRPGLCISGGATASAPGIWDIGSPWVDRDRDVRQEILGRQRATFVIDGDGSVVHVIPRVSPRTHDDEVLKALEQLSAAA